VSRRLAALALVIAACGPAGAGRTDKLVLTGSSTVAPLMAEIGKRFETVHQGARVDVQTGGSSRGITDTRQGLADLGMVSRALRAEENDLTGFAIAMDGICLIVHRDNPIAALDEQQTVDVFTGKVRDWREVGGGEAPITVVNKAQGRSTLELFLSHFGLEAEEIRPSVIIGDNEQGIKTVAGNPDAVGYVSIGAAEYAAENGVPIRLLPMDGVAASRASVRDGSFPLARPLTLVVRGEPTPLARELIDYARSPAVHDLVRELSFVPLGS
jgi:phosphate transport system substrate-binding protein